MHKHEKLGTKPDESVKGRVKQRMSMLWADKGSAPKSNEGGHQQRTRTHLTEGR